MRNKDKILTAFFLAIILWLVFYALDKYSKYPNDKTQKIAEQLPRYPNADNWQIANKKKLCFYYLTRCYSAPSTITFTTSAGWSSVYQFYRDGLTQAGWTYNSNIVTSIPSSMVVYNSNLFENTTCEVIVKNLDYNDESPQSDPKSFSISVTCS